MKKEVPRDRVALTLARCYEAIHRPDLAGPAYQAAVTERPQDFTVLHFVAEFYRRADQAETARGFYERLLEPGLSAPAETTTNARRHLAVLLAQAGNRARALALLDARSDAAPDLRIRWFIESSNPAARAGSIGRFQDSLSAQPPTSFERMLLAQMHEAAGSLETARTLLAEAVQDDPAPPQLARLARLLIQMGEMQEAERTIDHLDRLEPGSARVRQLRQGLVRDVQ
jgi:tetratricopeptide (TPR) repeat protein